MGQKAANKIIAGLQDAEAYARVDALLSKTRREIREAGDSPSQYDWGYRDGLMAARELFGKTYTFKIKRVR